MAREGPRRDPRGTTTERGLGAEWQRKARQAVRAHVARYGWWCPGYGVPPHASRDLTADHATARALGGGPEVGGIYCRSCNSRKGSGAPRPRREDRPRASAANAPRVWREV